MPKPRIKDRKETIAAAVEGRKPSYDDDFNSEVELDELKAKRKEYTKKYAETKDRDFYKKIVEIEKKIEKLEKGKK